MLKIYLKVSLGLQAGAAGMIVKKRELGRGKENAKWRKQVRKKEELKWTIRIKINWKRRNEWKKERKGGMKSRLTKLIAISNFTSWTLKGV